MDLVLFEWFSTVFFLIGVYIYSGKKASNPKVRMYGFSLYMIGGIMYIITTLAYQLYPYAITQIIFECLDIRGIINCRKEIKKNIKI